ncbi:MAG: hypothetical protein ACJAZ0_001833 [Halioglobus sp.]|jgi:hypothetical protein
MLPDTKPSRPGRRFVKRMLYSQMALRDAFLILIGKQSPNLSFTVLADPCSIYINFPIRKEMEQEFIDYINLGDGLSVVPMQTLAGDERELMLTLNIYEVSGLVNGPRAEWSTYIADSENIPRYMVLEARAAAGSLDPVNMFTRPDRVEHEVIDGKIVSTVASEHGNIFSSSIPLDEVHPMTQAATQWIEANDYIYWRNGICDRTSYNASVFNGKVRSVPPGDLTMSDETHWARFVEQPRNVLRYDGALEFVVSPWFNI